MKEVVRVSIYIASLVCTVLAIVFAAFLLATYCVNFYTIDAEIARIEQLRKDVAVAGSSDYVQALAAKTNADIVAMREFNNGMFGFVIPDQWDRVEIINIGQ